MNPLFFIGAFVGFLIYKKMTATPQTISDKAALEASKVGNIPSQQYIPRYMRF